MYGAQVISDIVFSYLDKCHNWAAPIPLAKVVAVFGRYSPELPQRLAHALRDGAPEYLVVSGNVGKDSGPLVRHGIPEAHYVVSAADALTDGHVLSTMEVGIDLTATNGVQNAQQMVRLMQGFGLGTDDEPGGLIVVAHRTSLFRLSLTLEQTMANTGLRFPLVTRLATHYEPQLKNPVDQWEICHEYVTLSDMSEAGHFPRPDGLRSDYVEAARRVRDQLAQELREQGIAAPSTAA